MQHFIARLRHVVVPLLVGCAALSAAGCGPRTIAYGVLLWGKDDPFTEGAVVPVVARSSIDATVTLWDAASRTRWSMEQWRVRSFSRRAEALALAEALAPYREAYAFTDRSSGIPVREKADPESKRVYKVAPGQLLKVLGRSAKKSQEGIYEDYWYEVLTSDGYGGFCFGHYLRSFASSRAEAPARMAAMLAEDPVLDKLPSDVWRPEYFADMLKNGRIDLTRFSAEIGLFPDRQASEWKLVLRDFRETYRFERTENPGSGVYTFPPTDLRMLVYPGDRVELSYRKEGKTVRSMFVQIDQDIDEVVASERDRRQGLLDAFLGRGSRLKSTAYGAIDLREDGTFSWTGYERVPTGVFLRPVSGRGKLDFGCHLDPSLEATYQGAVSLIFDEYRAGEESVFAYSFVSGGVQLTRIAPADIDELQVKRIGPSPLVMYFTFQAS